jgi:hypothetical protein
MLAATGEGMQRTVEQKRITKRRAGKRQDPRVKRFGIAPRTWPFIYVLVGNWVFAALIYGLAKAFWDWNPGDWTIGDRLALVIKDAVFAILPAVIAIGIAAGQRLNPNNFVGQTTKPNSALDINTRFILNTFEQFILFFIANAGLAVYCPLEEARTLPILTAIFLLGRMLFWIGYHYNPYMRAFGFGLTFWPTVVAYTWLFLLMVFDLRVPL